jgi:hypothetical protein
LQIGLLLRARTRCGAKEHWVPNDPSAPIIEPGDVLVVTRLDRLARSTRDLLNVLDAVGKAVAGVKALSDAWADTTTPHGRLMLTVLGGLAEFEPFLPTPNYTDSEERIEAEYGSIEQRDLFGSYTQERKPFQEWYFSFDWETENPFALFLRNLAASFGNVATFKEWDGSWTPQYRVCPDEAAALVGGDHDRAEEILDGHVALSEMPKEIRKPAMTKERAEWVALRAEEYRKELADDLRLLEQIGEQPK